MKPAWKKLHSAVVYRHPYWQVRRDRVVKPDGSRGYYYHVDVRDFVAVVALTADRRAAYLVGQYRYPTKRHSWEVPEGLIERGETPLRAAKRELAEEAGLAAKRWLATGRAAIANGLTGEMCYFFVAQGLTATNQVLEGGEADMVVKKYSIKEIESMIKNGKIDDAATIVAFHLLPFHQKKL